MRKSTACPCGWQSAQLAPLAKLDHPVKLHICCLVYPVQWQREVILNGMLSSSGVNNILNASETWQSEHPLTSRQMINKTWHRESIHMKQRQAIRLHEHWKKNKEPKFHQTFVRKRQHPINYYYPTTTCSSSEKFHVMDNYCDGHETKPIYQHWLMWSNY